MPAHKADDLVIPAQLICFVSSFLCLIQSLFIHGPVTEVLVRIKDASFITGTSLVSIKLVRDGWEMAGAGFIILTIGWGVLFTASDNLGHQSGFNSLASAFYFIAPAMILMTFYKPFKLYIKILLLINITPFLVSLAFKIADIKGDSIIYLSVINILFMHIVSVIWSIHLFGEHRKQKQSA